MTDEPKHHVCKLSLEECSEPVYARPKVDCTREEVTSVLQELRKAVKAHNYVPPSPRGDELDLWMEYLLDDKDIDGILMDLNEENFVGKVKDMSKGGKHREKRGFPPEFPYVFKYYCKLIRRDSGAKIARDNVLIYIKINNRVVPNHIVFVISFHKNRVA